MLRTLGARCGSRQKPFLNRILIRRLAVDYGTAYLTNGHLTLHSLYPGRIGNINGSVKCVNSVFLIQVKVKHNDLEGQGKVKC